jgi:predicted DNA-binding transcriptional regulator YafY
MRPADRLFQIVLLLGRGRVLTACRPAGGLGAHHLSRHPGPDGFGCSDRGRSGRRLLLTARLPNSAADVDEQELQALVFGADVAKSWGDTRMAQAADRILAKVDAVLPERLRPQLHSQRLVVPDVRMSESTTRMLGDVRDAINSRMRVFVEYHDVGGETTERIVWPLTLACWGKSWTLGAWCEARQDFRSFRVDRISTARRLRSTFPDEPGKRLEDYFASSGTRGTRTPQELRQ